MLYNFLGGNYRKVNKKQAVVESNFDLELIGDDLFIC